MPTARNSSPALRLPTRSVSVEGPARRFAERVARYMSPISSRFAGAETRSSRTTTTSRRSRRVREGVMVAVEPLSRLRHSTG